MKSIKKKRALPPLPWRPDTKKYDEIVLELAKDVQSKIGDSTMILSGTPHETADMRDAIYKERHRDSRLGYLLGNHIPLTKQEIIDIIIYTARSPEVMRDPLLTLQGSSWLPKHARRLPTLPKSDHSPWAFDYQDALQVAEGIQPSEPRVEEDTTYGDGDEDVASDSARF
jgi:hypothetical protein